MGDRMSEPTVYDCRREGAEPGSLRFSCNVRVLDARTGERIPNVFYLRTSPPLVGRFVTGPDGEPMVNPARLKRRVPDGRGGTRLEIYYDRLEVWEPGRRWVAVAVAGGGAVARSEGAD